MTALFTVGQGPTARFFAEISGGIDAFAYAGGELPFFVFVEDKSPALTIKTQDGQWPIDLSVATQEFPPAGIDGVAMVQPPLPNWAAAEIFAPFEQGGYLHLPARVDQQLWLINTGLALDAIPVEDDDKLLVSLNAKLDALLAARSTPEQTAAAVARHLLSDETVADFHGKLGVPDELALGKPFQNYLVYAVRSGALWALRSPEHWAMVVGILDALVQAPDNPQARIAAVNKAVGEMQAVLWPQN